MPESVGLFTLVTPVELPPIEYAPVPEGTTGLGAGAEVTTAVEETTTTEDGAADEGAADDEGAAEGAGVWTG